MAFAMGEQVIELEERREERRQEERAERKRAFRKRVLILALVAAVILGLAWLLFLSRIFVVSTDRLVIEGARGTSVSVEAVTEKVAEHQGENLILFSLGGLEGEIAALPDVAEADASIRFPRTLVVRVTGEAPFVCVMDGENCLPVSSQGEMLTVTKDELKVPVLSYPADSLELAQAANVAWKVLGALDSDLKAQLKEVEVNAASQVTLTTNEDRTIVWGWTDMAEQKSEVLKVLLTTDAAFIDVSVPAVPVTK